MGALSIYMVNFMSGFYTSELENRLQREVRLISELTQPHFTGELSEEELRVLSQRIGDSVDARVTVLNLDGVVLADNFANPDHMPNHKDRPEVQDAITEGIGKATRISATTNQELIYIAIPIADNGVPIGIARIAVPITAVDETTNRLITAITISTVVLTSLSVFLGYWLARRTSRSVRFMAEAARRLASGNLDQHIESTTSDETQDLANAFNSMAKSLQNIINDLSGERNKLSTILDTMSDGVVVIYRQFYLRPGEGRIELMNVAAQELLSIQTKNIIDHRFMETITDPTLQNLVSVALETGEQQNVEVELIHLHRHLTAIASPLKEDIRNRVLLTLHDLTRVRQADITRKEFVSNVSHELRSPIASIKAMVETLQNGAIEEKKIAEEFVQRIYNDTERMGRIVEELLDLSQLENPQIALDLISTDLRPLLEEINHEFKPQAEGKEITLVAFLPESLPPIVGERTKLRQVLVNLLDNAIKFTPQGGTITISTEILPGTVRVHVSDTGIGIDEQDQLRIFERFYRVDNSRRYQGTGLGLAIAKHIVQAHGGELTVVSHEGKGSIFSFTIPISP